LHGSGWVEGVDIPAHVVRRGGLEHLSSLTELKHPIGRSLMLVARKNLLEDSLITFANKKKQIYGGGWLDCVCTAVKAVANLILQAERRQRNRENYEEWCLLGCYAVWLL
jgi:hypothetical protein